MAKLGRPPKFETAEAMQEAIDLYFAQCANEEKPATVTGLTLALGFLDRRALLEYAEKDDFSDTVKKAKLRVQASIESGLLKGYNPAGAIFNLKNNFGWKDKQEIEEKSDQTHTFKWEG